MGLYASSILQGFVAPNVVQGTLTMRLVNMQHFLDEKGSTHKIPPKARELAEHFGAIVVAVTLDLTGRAVEVAEASCRNPDSPKCAGAIIGCSGKEADRIEWRCNECTDFGFITGWQGTLWDCGELPQDR